MAGKENPFSEFLKILENQGKEIEKMMKPILESQKKAREMSEPALDYQQKLFLESLELQKALMESIMDTTKRMLRMMSTEPARYNLGGSFPGNQFADYMRTMQTIQDNWMDQLKSTSSMFQEFMQGKK
jgi:UbiD family decarboxylase